MIVLVLGRKQKRPIRSLFNNTLQFADPVRRRYLTKQALGVEREKDDYSQPCKFFAFSSQGQEKNKIMRHLGFLSSLPVNSSPRRHLLSRNVGPGKRYSREELDGVGRGFLDTS